MKKKIMLLMVVIPIVFMLTIFSVSKVVSIIVDIPVSGIKITTQSEDGLITIDKATYEDDLYLTAEVFPYNAKNKGYSVDVTDVDGEGATSVIGVETQSGRIIANGVGRAKITVTSHENAFTDSVVVSVTSSKVLDFTPNIMHAGGEDDRKPVTLLPGSDDCDFTADITGGKYFFGAAINPQNLSDSEIRWSSDNAQILEIDEYTGIAKAYLSGTATVTAVNENGVDGEIEKKIKINVEMPADAAIAVNGTANPLVNCASDAYTVEFYVETTGGTPDIYGSPDDVISSELTPLGENQYKMSVTFKETRGESVTVNLSTDGGATSTEVSFSFEGFIFGVYTGYDTKIEGDMFHKQGSNVTYVALGEPYDKDVTFSWEISDDTIFSLSSETGTAVKLNALKEGTARVIVSAYKDGVQIGSNIIRKITVVKPVSELSFSANINTYGIGKLLALGDYKIDNSTYRRDYPALELKLRTAEGWKIYDGSADVIVTAEGENPAAKPRNTASGLTVDVQATGKVVFEAKWKHADYFGEDWSAKISFKAVKDGVSISSYDELKFAAEDGSKAVILNNDIMLGRAGASEAELKAMAKTMPTTYDWQFYANTSGTRPSVYYLIEFKNDVYGNGFEINGDNITTAKDATGAPLLFKGPLDFVSIATASVKAQDNIVFLARTKGITLDNVVLKGCSDKSLEDENGNHDLSKLNTVGTTLEIAENITVKNCRVSNGRTVVRIFGGYPKNAAGKPVVASTSEITAANERVTAKLESCILTSAREFIVKLGSNRAVLSTGDTEASFALSPLTKADGTPYTETDANNMSDPYFYNKYVITDVTLKNCALSTSGLFSIGVETHFAGIMLSGCSSLKPTGWEKLAATSYACALRLEGDVKLLDWKKLDNVNSSTLIETPGDLSENQKFLQLNINKMIEKVSGKPEYSNLVSNINNEQYVHGGVAFYGGGYNYSYIDFGKMTNEELPYYKVNLSILKEGEPNENTPLYLQGSMLPLAAGPTDFRFYMYNGTSATDYYEQERLLLSGEAFKLPAAE